MDETSLQISAIHTVNGLFPVARASMAAESISVLCSRADGSALTVGEEVRRRSLEQIIRPEARDRWTSLNTSGLNPEAVQQILQGASFGDLTRQWELFNLMEDTWPMLSKCLNEVKEGVQMRKLMVLPYRAEGAKEPSKRAMQKAALVRASMLNCLPDQARDENAFEDCLFDICDAFGKGFSVQEILWNVREVAGSFAILPRAFKWVHPRHYGFPNDLQSESRLMLSRAGDQLQFEEFLPDRFILARYKSKSGSAETGALLRCLASFWIGSNFAYDWALNLAQMFGLPIRWATYDAESPGADKRLSEICDMLQNLGSAGWGAFPSGTTLELKAAVQRAADNPQTYLMNLSDLACSLVILGQTLTSDAKGTGTQALGEVHASVRKQRITYVAKWVAETLNYQLVPALMRLNFGDNEEDPWFQVECEEREDAMVMAERDKTLIQDVGMQVPEAWFYNRHDVPRPAPGDVRFVPARR